MGSTTQSAGLCGPATSRHESDDTYGRVITRQGRYRVIVCKDDMQWIIQHSRKRGMGKVWQGVSYVTTRDSLTRLWREIGCAPEPELEALPPSFRRALK